MLDLLRKAVNTWAFRILLILIIGSFAFWGMGDVYQGGGQDQGPVATVAGQPVPAKTLERRFKQRMQQLNQRFDGQFTRQQARQMGLPRRLLDQLVNQRLYRIAASEAGLVASDPMVQKALRDQQAFQGANGEFSKQRFRQVLQRAGMSETEYLSSLRHDLVSRPLVQAIRRSAFVPKGIAEQIYRLRAETRQAAMVAVPYSNISISKQPNKAALRDIYKAQDAPFTAPESRDLTVLSFDATDLKAQIDLPEKAVQKAWEKRKDQYQSPAQRQVVQAVFDNKKTARRVAEAAKQPETSFADAVTAVRQESGAKPLDLGWVKPGDLPQAVDNAVFDLGEGAIGGPIQSGLGWHVVHIKAVKQKDTKTTLADVRDEIEADLLRQRGRDVVYETSTKVQDKLAAGLSLDKISEQLGLPLKQVQHVTEAGEIAGDGSRPDWLTEAMVDTGFNVAEGETSTLKERGKAGYFAVRVERVRPAEKKAFSAVRDTARQIWLRQQRRQQAQERIDKLAKRLRQGADPKQLAGDGVVQQRQLDGFRADGGNNVSMPQPLRDKLFAAKKRDVVTAQDDQGAYAARLVGISPGDADANPKAVQRMRDQVKRQLGSDLMAQFNQALRKRYDVTIHEERLAQLF